MLSSVLRSTSNVRAAACRVVVRTTTCLARAAAAAAPRPTQSLDGGLWLARDDTNGSGWALSQLLSYRHSYNPHRLQQLQQQRAKSNRSRRGLYDGKDVRFGNNRSFSMRATRRKFKPNVHVKRVYSEILDEMVRFHLTAGTLRSIDKAGGLDNYLLSKRDSIKEGEGFDTLKRIKQRLKEQKWEAAQLQQEAAAAATTIRTPPGSDGGIQLMPTTSSD